MIYEKKFLILIQKSIFDLVPKRFTVNFFSKMPFVPKSLVPKRFTLLYNNLFKYGFDSDLILIYKIEKPGKLIFLSFHQSYFNLEVTGVDELRRA